MSGTVIYDTTLGADAASIDTGASAIPTGFAGLLCALSYKTSTGANAWVRLNGDTGSNYVWADVYLSGVGSVSGSNSTGDTKIPISYNSGGGTYVSLSEFFIPNYAGTTFTKTVSSLAMQPESSNPGTAMYGGGWNNTAAVNQITVFPDTGNFKAGTRFTIIGIGGLNDKKITDLSDGGSIQADDEFVVARDGVNYKISGDSLGRVLLATASPSGAANVDFTGLDPTDFFAYELVWLLRTSDSADQQFKMQVNNDSTSGHYAWWLFDYAGNSSSGSDSAALLGYVPASSQTWGNGSAQFPAKKGGNTRNGLSTFEAMGTSTHFGQATHQLSFNISADITEVKVFAAAGNLTGEVRLYGIP